jgi:uncharacterized protein (DUF983 family)
MPSKFDCEWKYGDFDSHEPNATIVLLTIAIIILALLIEVAAHA